MQRLALPLLPYRYNKMLLIVSKVNRYQILFKTRREPANIYLQGNNAVCFYGNKEWINLNHVIIDKEAIHVFLFMPSL